MTHAELLPPAAHALGPMANGSLISSLSRDDAQQMQQYVKIVEFRNEVVSGAHPRVKLPPASAPSKVDASVPPPAPTRPFVASSSTNYRQPRSSPRRDGSATLNAKKMSNTKGFHANGQSLPGLGLLPPGSHPSGVPTGPATAKGTRPFASSGGAEIDPVLLTKSDSLIRAETQLHRQRLERSLRDQVDQQRSAKKVIEASDRLPEFVVADVLAKAEERNKQATALSATLAATSLYDGDVSANKSDGGDSFDEKTFYSSEFNSPFSPQIARIVPESEAEDVQMRDSPEYEPQLDLPSVQSPDDPVSAPRPLQSTSPAYQAPSFRPIAQPSFTSHAVGINARPESGQAAYYNDSADASASGESGNTDLDRSTDGQRSGTHTRQSSRYLQRPALRAHDVSPVAPQPEHISSLASSQPIPPVSGYPERRATPAQVSALRNEISMVSSPENSPQRFGQPRQGKNGNGNKAPQKESPKQQPPKKKKRKSGNLGNQVPVDPVIKAEPKSPSPLSAPPLRPNKAQQKRVRRTEQAEQQAEHTQVPVGQSDYNRSRPVPASITYTEQRGPGYPVSRPPDGGARVVYEQTEDGHFRTVPAVQLPGHYAERQVYDDRYPPPASPAFPHPGHEQTGAYPISYAPREIRTVRSVSHAVFEQDRDSSIYHRDTRGPPIASTRPPTTRDRSRSPVMHAPRMASMAPPSRIASRVVMDEFGREYIEPPRPQVVLRAMAPQGPGGDAEVLYERPSATAPARAMSRMPDGMDEGMVIRRGEPMYPLPRRVVTQPEYVTPDFRSYRQREYSARPMAPSEEFVQVRAAPERRMIDAAGMEYIPRAASVLPAEPIRYEIAGPYDRARVGSVAPQPLREYAAAGGYPEMRREYAAPPASTYPDMRREVLQHPPPPPQPMREYSVRPEPAPVAQRAYSVRPMEQPPQGYFARAPVHEEVVYAERPRGHEQEVIYVDDPRRQMY